MTKSKPKPATPTTDINEPDGTATTPNLGTDIPEPETAGEVKADDGTVTSGEPQPVIPDGRELDEVPAASYVVEDDAETEVTEADVHEMLDELEPDQREALRRGLGTYHREGADLREIAGF